MKQSPEYLHYLEEAKRAETADRLRLEGFTVELEKQIGDAKFDLVARKGDQLVAYEFKSVGSKRITRDAMVQLQQSANRSGVEFHLIVVNPPQRVTVEIDNLKSQLLDYVINVSFPQELDSLSSHTRITDLADIEVSDIRVNGGGINVRGTGNVGVTLEYGGGNERDGTEMSDFYPFHFSAKLDPHSTLSSVEEFTVDTSSFYE